MRGFSGCAGVASPASPLDPVPSDPLEVVEFFGGVVHSISQVFFKGDAVSALLPVAGLAVSSLAAAAFAVGGAVLAVVTAHLFGVASDLISSSIQGFGPVLTAIAFDGLLSAEPPGGDVRAAGDGGDGHRPVGPESRPDAAGPATAVGALRRGRVAVVPVPCRNGPA
jgi:hypothetical protein